MKKKTVLERIADKVLIGDDHWPWIGERSRQGYGMTHDYVDGVRKRRCAHRVVYELVKGPIPPGLTLEHTCGPGTEWCVRPDHLVPMPQRDNLLCSPRTMASINMAKTHCASGHLFDAANTGRTYRGSRRCRTCERDGARRRRRERG